MRIERTTIALTILLNVATAHATTPNAPPAAQSTLSTVSNVTTGAGGFTGLLLRSTLAASAAVVVVVLIARRYGRGAGAAVGGKLAIVERLRLEPRRTLYIVQAGRRSMLLASTERGIVKLGPIVDRRSAARARRAASVASRRSNTRRSHAQRALALRIRSAKSGASAR